jgi:outer membrane lipoprotein-sorting protein
VKKFLSLLPVLFIIILLDSCVPSKPAYEEAVYTSSRLIKNLEANRRKIKTFRGSGVINVSSPKLDAKASFEVILKKPDSLKISIYGPFGIDLAQAIVTKNSFVFYDALRNNLYEGGVKDDILQRIFKVNISFDDLMDAFAGSVNLTDKLSREPDIYIVNDDHYLLTYIDSVKKIKTIFKINIDDLAITDYQLSGLTGEPIFEGKYSDFKDFDQVAVPYKSFIENKSENQKLDIGYRSIDINKTTDKLEIKIPSDVNRIQM